MDLYEAPQYLQNIFPYLVALVCLEHVILYFQGNTSFRFNDTFVSLSLGLFQECFRLAIRGMDMVVYCHLHKHFRIIDLPEDTAWTWVCSALLVDFGFYWIHRANHEINILWSHHQVHHSADDFNTSIGLRHGILNAWLTWILYSPLAFFIPPGQFIINKNLNLLYQFWIHTETVGNLGPLEWILNTPEHHQIHHGCNKYLLDKNYGGVLIIWDKVFGTFQERKKEEKTIYNLVIPPNTFNLIKLQTFYYPLLWQRLKNFDNWPSKINALIKGPSWQPGSPWTGWEYLKISITERKKFEVCIPQWHQYYMMIHFFLLVATFETTIADKLKLADWRNIYIFLGYVVTTLIVFGCLIDGRPSWICFVEVGRCAMFFFIRHSIFSSPLQYPSSIVILGTIHLVIFYVSLLVWGSVALNYLHK